MKVYDLENDTLIFFLFGSPWFEIKYIINLYEMYLHPLFYSTLL